MADEFIQLPPSSEQHNALAAYIDRIYAAAGLVFSRPGRNGDANIVSIKRFAAKVCFGKVLAAAWITVKESRQHGHRIYSVEAIKLETLERKVEVVSGNTPHASSVPTRRIIAKNVSAYQEGTLYFYFDDNGGELIVCEIK